MSVVASRPSSGFVIQPLGQRDVFPYFALLAEARLPTTGLDAHLASAVVARASSGVIGGATVELYETAGLLRSVVVAPAWQGRGVGQALSDAVLAEARRRGVSAVFLLTLTAETFFGRRGFERIARSEVPAALMASAEFRGACPETAVVMRSDF